MTVDIRATRARLAEVIEQAVELDTITVYPSAIDGVAGFPAVVLGMPSWKPGPTGCLDSFEFPVAVVVDRPGISDEATVEALDDLWPNVLEGLQQAVPVVRAEFGTFLIQGQQYPAQILTCTFIQ